MVSKFLVSPPEGYMEWLKDVKERILASQQKAVLAANSAMITLYWDIGREILARQGRQGWGAKVVDRLAGDLRREFPGMKGFSSRNLKYMRFFAEAWTDDQFVQRVVAQIPWGHNLEILTKLKSREEREWYARAAIEYGWSRPIFVQQIESGLYHRQGKAITNFDKHLLNAMTQAPNTDHHGETHPRDLVEENKTLLDALINVIDIGMKFDNPASDMIFVARGALKKIGHRADERQSIEKIDLKFFGTENDQERENTQYGQDDTSVLTKAIIRATEHLALSQAKLADVLGLSPVAVSRLFSGDYQLTPKKKKVWERGVLVVRLFRYLDTILGGSREDAQKWLNSPNHALANQKPIDLITSTEGLVRVVICLGSRAER